MRGLISTVCLLSVCDLFFTLWAHQFTSLHELNPLARPLLQADMIASLVGFKVGLTALGAGIFWRLRHRVPAEVGIWAVLMIYVLLAFRWASYTQAAQGM